MTRISISIRSWPPAQVRRRLRARGIRQHHIAAVVGVSQTFVSRVIARTVPLRPSVKSEAVWRAIEKALA